MKTLIILSLFLSTSAFSDSTTASGACQELVKAAQDNSYEAFKNVTLTPPAKNKEGPPGQPKGKKKFEKMHGKYLEKLKGMTCGAEMVADDHAVVESTSQGKNRLVPFVKQDGNWKFDMRTYIVFYHLEQMRGKHPKH